MTAPANTRVRWIYGPVDAATRAVAASGDVIRFDPPSMERSAFAPLRGVLRTLIGDLAAAGHEDLLAECGPELTHLLPEVAELIPEGPALHERMQMPLGLARMLPIESELVFRVAARVGWLVQDGLRRLGRAPLLWFPALDRADRPTLVIAYNLCLRALAGGPAVVIGAAERPVRGPGVDGASIRVADLAAVRDRVGGTETVLDAPPEPPPAELGEDREAAAVRRALAERTEAAVADAVACSSALFNPAAVLDLVEAVGDVLSGAARAQAVGIALATVGRFTEARRCFDEGHALAEGPEERARLAMFSALVSAKRLGDFTSAADGVARGRAALEGCPPDTSELALEHGWLLNLAALVAHRTGDPDLARRHTRAALRILRPHGDEESVALKTNLVVNTSIIAETRGQPREALEIWKLFLRIFDRSPDSFVHFYHFREAGLLAKAGDPAAITVWKRVFTLAEELGNLPGMLGSARALVRLSYVGGDHTSAAGWARKLADLCVRLGDVDGVTLAWLAVAACAEAAGDGVTERGAVKRAQDAYLSPQVRDLVRRAASGEASPDELIPAAPPTMVRYPVALFLPPLPPDQDRRTA